MSFEKPARRTWTLHGCGDVLRKEFTSLDAAVAAWLAAGSPRAPGACVWATEISLGESGPMPIRVTELAP